MKTEDKILQQTIKLFAEQGYGGVSIRNIARNVNIAPSVLYHYFPDKDTLLKAMFDKINTELGTERSELPVTATASEMLKQRIIFQLDHAAEIVAVLKFYLAYRNIFHKIPTGFVPDKAYLHIKEVFEFGIITGEFAPVNISEQAKVITHAINGFVLEYYPFIPEGKEKEDLVEQIHKFLIRAIAKGGEKYEKFEHA